MRRGEAPGGRGVATSLLLDTHEAEEWAEYLDYPCPTMVERHRYTERVLREGGVLPKVVADFAKFTGPGPFTNRDVSIGHGYCARLVLNTSGYPWDRAELTVGRESSIHAGASVPFVAHELTRVSELHRSVAVRVRGLQEIDADPPEISLAGGWSMRLTGGIRGRRGRRVTVSVGPLGAEHRAFLVQVPEEALLPMANMYDELADFRESRVRRLERAHIRMESAPPGVDPTAWAYSGRFWDGLVAEGCVTREAADEAMLDDPPQGPGHDSA